MRDHTTRRRRRGRGSCRRSTGNRGWRSRVFEAALVVLWESWASWGRLSPARACGLRIVEFVPNLVVAVAAGVLFVESHDIHHGLRVLLLFLLRNAILLEQTLPFFGKTGKLTGLIIVADMGNVDWVLWG